MNLDRPLEDFIKDSLRAKRAERTENRKNNKGIAKSRKPKPGAGNDKNDGKQTKANKQNPASQRASQQPSQRPSQQQSQQASQASQPATSQPRTAQPRTTKSTDNETAFRRRGGITKRRRGGRNRRGGMGAQGQQNRDTRKASPQRRGNAKAERRNTSPGSESPVRKPHAHSSSRSPSPVRNSRASPKGRGITVAVSNLHPGVTQADITELFETVGPLKHASLQTDGTGKSIGEAEVVFETMMDALSAIKKYNMVPLDNQPLHITLVTNHTQNGGGQGGENPHGNSRYRRDDDGQSRFF